MCTCVAWQQHDVQELCRVMFDALEKRFKKDGYERSKDLINDLYQGTMKDYVKCLEVRGLLLYCSVRSVRLNIPDLESRVHRCHQEYNILYTLGATHIDALCGVVIFISGPFISYNLCQYLPLI